MCVIKFEKVTALKKIIVARLLKLIVLHIRVNESVWHANTKPKYFSARFVKDLDQLRDSFLEGLQFHSSTQ